MKKQNEQFIKSSIARMVAYQKGGRRDVEDFTSSQDASEFLAQTSELSIDDVKEIIEGVKPLLPEDPSPNTTTGLATLHFYNLMNQLLKNKTSIVSIKKDGSHTAIVPKSFGQTIGAHLPVISVVAGAGIGLGIAHLSKANMGWKVGGAIIGAAVGLASSMAYQHFSAPEQSSHLSENPCSDNPNRQKRCYDPHGYCKPCGTTSGGNI